MHDGRRLRRDRRSRRGTLVLLASRGIRIRHELRAGRVRLDVVAVDRLDHEQEVAELVEELTPLLQDPLCLVVGFVEQTTRLLVDQPGGLARDLGLLPGPEYIRLSGLTAEIKRMLSGLAARLSSDLRLKADGRQPKADG